MAPWYSGTSSPKKIFVVNGSVTTHPILKAIMTCWISRALTDQSYPLRIPGRRCRYYRTNTFSTQRISLADYHLEELAYELSYEGARIAREVADEYNKKTPGKPRFVAAPLVRLTGLLSFSWCKHPGFRAVSFDATLPEPITIMRAACWRRLRSAVDRNNIWHA